MFASKKITVLLCGLLALLALSSGALAGYVVASEDVLSVVVYDEPELSVKDARISSAGTLAMPLIGEIKVAGLSPEQIASKIEAVLADGYLKRPRVSVTIAEYRQFYVNGAVKKPGGYPYQEGLTVQRAVVLAGGLTERASTSKISVAREANSHASVPVTLNHPVGPGDVVTVGESFF